jgi:NTP pyrophosphatase (non-canonical NTP hydrolase)
MNLAEMQQQIADFVQKHKLNTTVEARVLDLVSEVGEVAKEVLKGNDYGKTDFSPTAEWSSELADAFFSLICIANSTGVDLDSALSSVLQKYEKRLAEKGDAGSGS